MGLQRDFARRPRPLRSPAAGRLRAGSGCISERLWPRCSPSPLASALIDATEAPLRVRVTVLDRAAARGPAPARTCGTRTLRGHAGAAGTGAGRTATTPHSLAPLVPGSQPAGRRVYVWPVQRRVGVSVSSPNPHGDNAVERAPDEGSRAERETRERAQGPHGQSGAAVASVRRRWR